MNEKLSGILGIILSIVIFVYFEIIFNKLLFLIGINLNNYSSFTLSVINLIIRLGICFLIYLIYKKDLRRNSSSNNIFKMLLYLLVGVVLLTIIMYLFNYIINYVCDIFKVDKISSNFYNIFDKKLNFNLIIKIVNDYIINPYLYVSIVLLSVDKLTRRTDTFIFYSGLVASIIYGLTLSGTVIYIILNSITTFILFSLLALCYKRIKSIWFIIFLYSLYLITYLIILNYLGL